MRIGQLTVTIDPEAKAIYIYLRPKAGFESCKQERPFPGVIVDLDAQGNAIGVEFFGTGKLDIQIKKLVPKYHIPKLEQVLTKQEAIEEELAGVR